MMQHGVKRLRLMDLETLNNGTIMLEMEKLGEVHHQ